MFRECGILGGLSHRACGISAGDCGEGREEKRPVRPGTCHAEGGVARVARGVQKREGPCEETGRYRGEHCRTAQARCRLLLGWLVISLDLESEDDQETKTE